MFTGGVNAVDFPHRISMQKICDICGNVDQILLNLVYMLWQQSVRILNSRHCPTQLLALVGTGGRLEAGLADVANEWRVCYTELWTVRNGKITVLYI